MSPTLGIGPLRLLDLGHPFNSVDSNPEAMTNESASNSVHLKGDDASFMAYASGYASSHQAAGVVGAEADFRLFSKDGDQENSLKLYGSMGTSSAGRGPADPAPTANERFFTVGRAEPRDTNGQNGAIEHSALGVGFSRGTKQDASWYERWTDSGGAQTSQLGMNVEWGHTSQNRQQGNDVAVGGYWHGATQLGNLVALAGGVDADVRVGFENPSANFAGHSNVGLAMGQPGQHKAGNWAAQVAADDRAGYATGLGGRMMLGPRIDASWQPLDNLVLKAGVGWYPAQKHGVQTPSAPPLNATASVEWRP